MSTLLNVQFWAFVGVIAGIYTIFGLGIQVQFGLTGLLNFGQVAFMAIGAYTTAILVVKEDMSLWLAGGAGVAAAVAFALLLGLPTLRLRADYLAIVTIAFSEIVRYVAINEDRLTGGSQGTINLLGVGNAASYNDRWELFQLRVQEWLRPVLGDLVSKDVAMLVIVWTIVLVTLLLLTGMARSPWGRVLRSIREDEDAAAALGKNVFSYKLQSFAVGAVLGAAAGLLYAFEFSFFSPDDFAPLVTFFAWTIVILGGVGRLWGVPAGALVFGFVYAATRFLDFPPFSSFDSAERAYVRLVVVGLILIGLVYFRPQGFFGKREEMVLE